MLVIRIPSVFSRQSNFVACFLAFWHVSLRTRTYVYTVYANTGYLGLRTLHTKIDPEVIQYDVVVQHMILWWIVKLYFLNEVLL